MNRRFMCRFGQYHEPFYSLWRTTLLGALSSIKAIVSIQINVQRNKIYGKFSCYMINKLGRGRLCPQMPLLKRGHIICIYFNLLCHRSLVISPCEFLLCRGVSAPFSLVFFSKHIPKTSILIISNYLQEIK